MMNKPITLTSIVLMFHSFIMGQGSVYKSGKFVRVSNSDSIQTQLLAAGQTVEMFGWLGNDLFSAAEVISIDGTIADDAIIAGRQIVMRGHVGDLLMGVAETILIDGEIEGDLFVAGKKVRIAEDAHIRGNVHIAAASVIFEGGRVDGIFRAAGESFNLNEAIHNKAELYGQDFTFGSTYQAGHGTDITSNQQIYRENLGHIPENLNIRINEPSMLPWFLFKAGFYLSLLITGLVLVRIFEQSAVDMYRFSTEQFWKNTGIGILTFLLVSLAGLMLLFLIFTIPLSIILMLLYGLALMVSYLLVAMILGAWSILYFWEDTAQSVYYWGLILGIFVIAILVNLPFVGWLFNVLLLFFGLGSLVYYIWRMRSLSPKAEHIRDT